MTAYVFFASQDRSASAMQDSKIKAGVLLPCVEPCMNIGEIQKLRGEFWGADRQHYGIGLNGYFLCLVRGGKKRTV